MANVVAVEPQAHGDAPAVRPYAPSWVDRVTDGVRRLPGPSALYYGGATLAVALAEVAIKWNDGTYQSSGFRLYHIVLMVTGFYYLAIIHQLDDNAAQALARFRPVLTADDAEYARLRYELTTLPAVPTFVASAVTMLSGLVMLYLTTPETLDALKVLTSPAAVGLELGAWVFGWWTGGAALYHTIHQLRVVSWIYAKHTRITVFEQGPLYALSVLTAQTAALLVLITYAWVVAIPDTWAAPERVVPGLTFFGLALATFVGPLIGAHQRLQIAKEQRQSLIARRMEAITAEVHRRAEAGEYAGMEALNTTLDALLKERAVLDKVPTWPWQPGTLSALATAILLPVVLWLITRVLERVLAF